MSLVTREDVGRVAVLTLNNPPANGYSLAMHQALDTHVVAVRMDEGVDVVVLRGAGEKFFCGGADIAYLGTLSPGQKYVFCLHANETLLRIENTPKLFIAALNGHCVGGGLEVALACDLRIGRASGAKPNLVGLPEVGLGVLPGTGGTQRLTRLVGRARALELMVEGRNFPVEEALSLGLVHRVLPEEGWWEMVLAYATSFCLPTKAAGAVGLIKRAVLAGADLPIESGLAIERELQQRLFTAPDAKEGIDAFLGRRAAAFVGFAGAPAAPSATTTATQTAVVPHREPPPREAPSSREESSPPPGLHPRIDLSRTRIPDAVLNLMPRDTVERCKAIPVRLDGNTLVVAMAYPEDAEAVATIAADTGYPVRPLAADLADIGMAVGMYYRA